MVNSHISKFQFFFFFFFPVEILLDPVQFFHVEIYSDHAQTQYKVQKIITRTKKVSKLMMYYGQIFLNRERSVILKFSAYSSYVHNKSTRCFLGNQVYLLVIYLTQKSQTPSPDIVQNTQVLFLSNKSDIRFET